ncbi:GlxA family transcriptional regulator [Streptomyces sp. VRA16 Mangrove soil]|uniref:GlxA family transcriptional regulator n=1 Tax=Streptomyces sp. VRA16 Mangrove soil TaxID=2817434 RepID=UPI001A9E3DFF|nr:DJ-1/PfpI family protein [Streptomyces sp. VRA16 Mangrove soil]MBO1330448.1 DJ-1/PfpI family protein [Streptomyces sp. VRA16 Mangrove soil]
MASSRTVVLVAYDGIQLTELAGPMDVFHAANTVLESTAYRIVTAAPRAGTVTVAGGLKIHVEHSIREAALGETDIDTMIVIGGFGAFDPSASQEVVRELPVLAGVSQRVTAVCAGAMLLAAAGLLDGYRATTHWAATRQLAERYPRVRVEPDRIYVHDRDRWTSAGVTASIDLALALVEYDHGAEVAQSIARSFVVFTRRPGGQNQFSAQMRAQTARTPAVRSVQDWLPDHLDEDLSVAALACRAGMSERSFARAFRAETGSTPADLVESLRLEAACRLLETTALTVGAIARTVGYRHGETLHRVFSRRLATTPDRYRRNFPMSTTADTGTPRPVGRR